MISINSRFEPPRRILLNLAPGATLPISVVANMYYFKEASHEEFAVSLDVGDFISGTLAMGFECDPGDAFQQIRVRNDSVNPLTAELIVGRGRVIDNRLNVLDGRSGSASTFIPTRFQKVYTGALAAATSYTIAAATARERLIVYADGEFILCPNGITDAGVPATLLASGRWVAEISTLDIVAVRNPGASPITISVSQLFGFTVA